MKIIKSMAVLTLLMLALLGAGCAAPNQSNPTTPSGPMMNGTNSNSGQMMNGSNPNPYGQ